ncbi:HNH endonuclease [Endozoicomonas sp. OPT23]|nr:HNH endonuclease [Endozoicomonas sp. OPT23]
MAERVGWRCSFPGCNISTVGPDSDDPTKRINNGIAAHIYAAAPNGPRFNPEMTRDERRHITNGIWMCRNHGSLIDVDYTEYSAATLIKWKEQAERNAAEILKEPALEGNLKGSSLIQIGSKNILYARWKSIHQKKWDFEIVKSEIGNSCTISEYVLSFSSLPESEQYVVSESQGDARKIKDIELTINSENKNILTISVEDKITPTDPRKSGTDMAIGPDGDIFVENGSFAHVSGIENAKQMISICMSTLKGEIESEKDLGSLATEYYNRNSDDLILFSRLIKLELIRLSLIPIERNFNKELRPSLPFIKRFLEVSIVSKELIHSRIQASVKLEWGHGEQWEGLIPIFVLTKT